jgi:hypothetical protein
MDCCPDWDQVPERLQAVAQRRAQDLIWMLSGRRFGLCTVTVRPCRTPCAPPPPPAWWSGVGFYPAVVSGRMVNVAACGCRGSSCSCGPECSVRLAPGPVAAIDQVQVDGVEVPADEYQVLDGRHLVRVGGGCWPDCQRFDRPDGQPGTWSVTYRYGIPPPAGALAAAASYACELGKACTGSGRCRLPQRVQSITRDGVSMTMLDPLEFLEQGRTGLPEVDTWLAAVNPNSLPEAPRVLSPDVRRPRVVTWP